MKYTKDVKVDDIVGNFPNIRKAVQADESYDELVNDRCEPGWMAGGDVEPLTTPLLEEHRRTHAEDGQS